MDNMIPIQTQVKAVQQSTTSKNSAPVGEKVTGNDFAKVLTAMQGNSNVTTTQTVDSQQVMAQVVAELLAILQQSSQEDLPAELAELISGQTGEQQTLTVAPQVLQLLQQMSTLPTNSVVVDDKLSALLNELHAVVHQSQMAETDSVLGQFNALLTEMTAQTDVGTGTQQQAETQLSFLFNTAIKGQTESAEPINLEQLQKTVDSAQGMQELMSRIAGVNMIPVATTTVQTDFGQTVQQSVMTQLMDGVLQNINTGKNEFTVTLYPEGLGEVTVKLTELAGRMQIAFAATSADTARLLSAEIGALRSALQPLNAELTSITVAQAHESTAGAFDNAAGFLNQQNAQEFFRDSAKQIQQNDGEDFEEMQAELLQNLQLHSLLSARV